ncbi:MAG: hypothetical protein QXX82_02180 [Nitrososphaerota archaeon]
MVKNTVKVDELVRSGKLSPFSPIYLTCCRLGVKWLPYVNGCIYGPTPGITETLDVFLTCMEFDSMLDLFCGSGALSKLAYLRGVREIVAVDMYTESAVKNIGKISNIRVVRADALTFRDGCYDLLVADPPEKLIKTFIKNLSKISRMYKHVALIWLGPYSKVSRYRSFFTSKKNYKIIEVWGDAIMVTWKRNSKREVEKALASVQQYI